MQTTTLILGLIAATFLFLGGCSGFFFGSFAVGVEEAFEIEQEQEGVTSEDVQGAGAFAILIAVFMFLAAGLAKVALRTSLVLLLLAIPMLIGLITVDTTSLFAVTYYMAILLTGTCCVLMFIEWRRQARSAQSDAE